MKKDVRFIKNNSQDVEFDDCFIIQMFFNKSNYPVNKFNLVDDIG